MLIAACLQSPVGDRIGGSLANESVHAKILAVKHLLCGFDVVIKAQELERRYARFCGGRTATGYRCTALPVPLYAHSYRPEAITPACAFAG